MVQKLLGAVLVFGAAVVDAQQATCSNEFTAVGLPNFDFGRDDGDDNNLLAVCKFECAGQALGSSVIPAEIGQVKYTVHPIPDVIGTLPPDGFGFECQSYPVFDFTDSATNLTGTIPDEIGDISFTFGFRAPDHLLTSIPAALKNSGNLAELNLKDNLIDTSLTDLLDGWNTASLQILKLDGNAITGLYSDVALFTFLTSAPVLTDFALSLPDPSTDNCISIEAVNAERETNGLGQISTSLSGGACVTPSPTLPPSTNSPTLPPSASATTQQPTREPVVLPPGTTRSPTFQPTGIPTETAPTPSPTTRAPRTLAPVSSAHSVAASLFSVFAAVLL